MRMRGLFWMTAAAFCLTGCMSILRGAADLVPDAPQTTFVKNLPAPGTAQSLQAAVAKSQACNGKKAHWDHPEDNRVTLTCRQSPGNRIVFSWTVDEENGKTTAKLTDVRVSAPTQQAFVGFSGGAQSATALLKRLLMNEPLLTDEFVRDQLPGA